MLSNTNIAEIKELVTPAYLIVKYNPLLTDGIFLRESRKTVENILLGKDPRLMVICGPCSIHDYDLAIEYGKRLSEFQTMFPNLYIVMRVYFEKPRTRKGWKGFIYDPDLDESFKINKGLDLARKLLLELTKMRIPIGTEFLDTITPQYLADLISWGAIGARTSESQIHRQLASGLSMPIGFKNLTSGDFEKAIDGIISATHPHNFLGIDVEGSASHVITHGNKYGHLILRGGTEPNYDEDSLAKVTELLKKESIQTGFIVDCSHGNSKKVYNRQILVALYIKRLLLQKKFPIRGIMLESNIKKGNQPLAPLGAPLGTGLEYGISITDACIDIDTTRLLLSCLNKPTMLRCETIQEIRNLIRNHDKMIYSDDIDIEYVESKYHVEQDEAILEICKGLKNEERLLMTISARIALSCRLAELKFWEQPLKFLQSDSVSLITDRVVEREIVTLFPNEMFVKIIETSKNVQMVCLKKLRDAFRLGHFDPFSLEIPLSGTHVRFPSYDTAIVALRTGLVDAVLVPTYNSVLGDLLPIDCRLVTNGSVDNTLQLCLFSNILLSADGFKKCDRLYIEQNIYNISKRYIQSNIRASHIVYLENSDAGLTECLKRDGVCFTIASAKNKSPFLHTLDEIPGSITTFSFVLDPTQMQQNPAFLSLANCIDVHCC